MADLLFRTADEVSVKLKHERIVVASASDYDTKINLEIIAMYDNGYFVFVPSKYNLQGSVYVDKGNAFKLNIPERFLDSRINYITDEHIVSLYNRREGCTCSRCEEFYHHSEPNQEDGSMICYQCREDRFR